MKVFRKMGWIGSIILIVLGLLLGKCAYDEAEAQDDNYQFIEYDDTYFLCSHEGCLRIEEELSCSHYNKSKHYKHRASVEKEIAADLGEVYSPYDKIYHPTIKHTDIEHIVPTKEAHDSGMCWRNIELRKEFANDLLNLTLATPSVNRSKGSQDPAEWMPEHNQCWYIGRWWDVKLDYGLSMDKNEAAIVHAYLTECESFELEY